MEILNNTSLVSNPYKFNLLSKLILTILFSLGIYYLVNFYHEIDKAKLWIESITMSISESGIGGGYCATGLYDKAYYFKSKLFTCYLIGGIISLLIFRKNKWKFSSSVIENLILLSPIILYLTSNFIWK